MLLPDAPGQGARHGLLRTILQTAYRDDLIEASPYRIRGAGSVTRATRAMCPPRLSGAPAGGRDGHHPQQRRLHPGAVRGRNTG